MSDEKKETNKGSITVLDGGFSSQISRYDKSFDGHPLWSSLFLSKNPELVFETHLDYLRVGADIITTNTYQASIGGFKKYLDENLTEEQCIELIERAVKLAKEARDFYEKEREFKEEKDKKILIAGSVGPYGASLHDGSEYNGSYIHNVSSDEMKQWHKPRIQALVRAGVDLLAFETMPASKEVEILIKILKKYPTMKAWVSFSCKDGMHTNFGENFQDVARKCYNMNPDQIIAVGVNCTKPEYVESLFKDFNTGKKEPIPLIVYPNSGETYDAEKGWINKGECKPIESYVHTWIKLGVKYIGGCCRTYDENIGSIRKEVDRCMEEQ
ncbi:uncharacterized protein CBL_03134 [Carabus blaptoides fortunei]